MMNKKEIGQIIKDRRKMLGLKQQEIADLSQIGINTLVAIERGEGNPKLETLINLFETLGLTMEIKTKSIYGNPT